MNKPTIYTYNSWIPGNTVAIMGWVHGNERSGVETVKFLQKKILTKSLAISAGKLYLILANPRAIEGRIRHIDEDLNRTFGRVNTDEKATREESLSRILTCLLKKCDYLIDIHDSSPHVLWPFAFTDDDTLASLCSKEVWYQVKRYGTNDEYQRAILDYIVNPQGGSSDWFMQRIGKRAICIEAGLFNQPNIGMAIQNVENILRALHLLPWGATTCPKQKLLRWGSINLPWSAIFSPLIPNGTLVKSGDIIGKIPWWKDIICPTSGYIMFQNSSEKKSSYSIFLPFTS